MLHGVMYLTSHLTCIPMFRQIFLERLLLPNGHMNNCHADEMHQTLSYSDIIFNNPC